jgi:hypothetical protein
MPVDEFHFPVFSTERRIPPHDILSLANRYAVA